METFSFPMWAEQAYYRHCLRQVQQAPQGAKRGAMQWLRSKRSWLATSFWYVLFRVCKQAKTHTCMCACTLNLTSDELCWDEFNCCRHRLEIHVQVYAIDVNELSHLTWFGRENDYKRLSSSLVGTDWWVYVHMFVWDQFPSATIITETAKMKNIMVKT